MSRQELNPKKLLFQTNNYTARQSHIFPSENADKCLNLLIYGIKIQKHFKKSTKFFHNCLFYILEDDLDYLQWLSHSKPYNSSRIDLRAIKNITDDPCFDSKLAKRFDKFKDIHHLLFISYGESNHNKVMILRFKDLKLKNYFWQGLQHMCKKAVDRDSCFGDVKKVIAKKLFLRADKDGSKTLDFEEIKKILQQLHIEVNYQFLLKFFDKYDKDNNREIDWNEFQEIIDDISLKPELKEVFLEYCKLENTQNLRNSNELPRETRMYFPEFQAFLRKEQKQEISEVDFCQILHLLHSETPRSMILGELEEKKKFNEEKQRLWINFSEFCTIIFSKNNEIFDPEKLEIYQDMSRPLSEYYINSSHNTYLLANQLTGESSTKAYVNAFAKGCRCVELDCWEGEKGEPIITHGYTFTSKILFRDVIQTIKDYAFANNPFPVILSLENHCNLKQQEKMAEIMDEILGAQLYALPENFNEYEKFPSPKDLQYKVLLKDKASLSIISSLEAKEIKIEKNDEECDDDEIYISLKGENIENMCIGNDWGLSQKRFILQKNLTMNAKIPLPESRKMYSLTFGNVNKTTEMAFNNDQFNLEEGSNNSLEGGPLDLRRQNTKKSHKLKKLLVFFGIKLDLSMHRSIWHISSIKENKIEKLIKEKEDELQVFTRHFFLRVYPSGTRIDSSNFEPIKCFNFGVQMIALNFQKPDIGLLLYLSKFKENGGPKCGYILKPSFLLPENPGFLKKFTHITKILLITVISGQQLRPENQNDVRDVVDPYVEVSFRGTANDEKENCKPFRSNVIENNGFDPKFGLKCQFKMSCPALAMIVFKVFDQEVATKDMRIGWNAIPFGCMRPGFRLVPLLNSNLENIEFSCLLVKIQFYDVIDEI